MIPNTAFSPSVSLVHKWPNAVAAEMRALHWGAERVFFMLSLAVVPFMPPSWPVRTSLNEKEGGGRRYDALLRYSQELAYRYVPDL